MPACRARPRPAPAGCRGTSSTAAPRPCRTRSALPRCNMRARCPGYTVGSGHWQEVRGGVHGQSQTMPRELRSPNANVISCTRTFLRPSTNVLVLQRKHRHSSKWLRRQRARAAAAALRAEHVARRTPGRRTCCIATETPPRLTRSSATARLLCHKPIQLAKQRIHAIQFSRSPPAKVPHGLPPQQQQPWPPKHPTCSGHSALTACTSR